MPGPTPQRQISKNDLRMAAISAENDRFALIVGTIRHAILCAAVLGCIYLIFEGIKPILGREASAIQAFASVVGALSLSKIVFGIAQVGTASAWYLERKGKKRALIEKAKYQSLWEGSDAYRSSSNNPL